MGCISSKARHDSPTTQVRTVQTQSKGQSEGQTPSAPPAAPAAAQVPKQLRAPTLDVVEDEQKPHDLEERSKTDPPEDLLRETPQPYLEDGPSPTNDDMTGEQRHHVPDVVGSPSGNDSKGTVCEQPDDALFLPKQPALRRDDCHVATDSGEEIPNQRAALPSVPNEDRSASVSTHTLTKEERRPQTSNGQEEGTGRTNIVDLPLLDDDGGDTDLPANSLAEKVSPSIEYAFPPSFVEEKRQMSPQPPVLLVNEVQGNVGHGFASTDQTERVPESNVSIRPIPENAVQNSVSTLGDAAQKNCSEGNDIPLEASYEKKDDTSDAAKSVTTPDTAEEDNDAAKQDAEQKEDHLLSVQEDNTSSPERGQDEDESNSGAIISDVARSALDTETSKTLHEASNVEHHAQDDAKTSSMIPSSFANMNVKEDPDHSPLLPTYSEEPSRATPQTCSSPSETQHGYKGSHRPSEKRGTTTDVSDINDMPSSSEASVRRDDRKPLGVSLRSSPLQSNAQNQSARDSSFTGHSPVTQSTKPHSLNSSRTEGNAANLGRQKDTSTLLDPKKFTLSEWIEKHIEANREKLDDSTRPWEILGSTPLFSYSSAFSSASGNTQSSFTSSIFGSAAAKTQSFSFDSAARLFGFGSSAFAPSSASTQSLFGSSTSKINAFSFQNQTTEKQDQTIKSDDSQSPAFRSASANTQSLFGTSTLKSSTESFAERTEEKHGQSVKSDDFERPAFGSSSAFSQIAPAFGSTPVDTKSLFGSSTSKSATEIPSKKTDEKRDQSIKSDSFERPAFGSSSVTTESRPAFGSAPAEIQSLFGSSTSKSATEILSKQTDEKRDQSIKSDSFEKPAFGSSSASTQSRSTFGSASADIQSLLGSSTSKSATDILLKKTDEKRDPSIKSDDFERPAFGSSSASTQSGPTSGSASANIQSLFGFSTLKSATESLSERNDEKRDKPIKSDSFGNTASRSAQIIAEGLSSAQIIAEGLNRISTREDVRTLGEVWDYESTYMGQCDEFVWNNPPPRDLGSGVNWQGNRWTSLKGGGYHYANHGTDGGFYIRNGDGSSYHFSPHRGGRFTPAR